MIRIAYVINYIVKNGPSSVVLNIINNLDREKYDVSLITLFFGNNPEVIEYLKSNGVSVYECATLSRMKCLLGQCKEFDDTVKKGQVVAIVEAMKLMNEIESEVDGVIAEVLVKNGEMVDYGKPLFRVKA